MVAVAGELDMSTAGVLEQEVWRNATDGVEEIVLDLRDVAFMDSSGLRSLVVAKRICDRRAVRLSLRQPSARARRIHGAAGKTGGSHAENIVMGDSAADAQRSPVFSESSGPANVSGWVTRSSAPAQARSRSA